ncbi:MAG: hypothetical protein QXS54_11470 [Candidatus Methanomethylicaceae archaeon]
MTAASIVQLLTHRQSIVAIHQHSRRSTHRGLKRLRARLMRHHEARKAAAASFNAGGKVEQCFFRPTKMCRSSNSAMCSRSLVSGIGNPCDLAFIAAALEAVAVLATVVRSATVVVVALLDSFCALTVRTAHTP